MERFLGIVIATRSEGRALFGRGGWDLAGNWRIRRQDLPDGTRVVAVCAGVGGRRAAQAAHWLVAEGAGALAVAGVAGGLDPSLCPGDLVIADEIIDRLGEEPNVSWPTDPGAAGSAHAALAAEGIPARRATVVTVLRPALTPDDKRRLHAETGALAVDMETAAVARAASEGQIPLLVLRTVSDTADRHIPDDFVDSLDRNGEVRPVVLLRKILRRPSLAVSAARAGRDYAAALASLKRAWRSQALSGLVARLVSGARDRTSR